MIYQARIQQDPDSHERDTRAAMPGRHGLLICLLIAGAVLDAQAIFHSDWKWKCASVVGTIDGGICDGLHIDTRQCTVDQEGNHMQVGSAFLPSCA